MVVNPITLTPKVAEVNEIMPQETDNASPIPDKVSISSNAREIQQKRVQSKELAKKVIEAAPDIREEKISEVINRLNTRSVQEEEIVNTLAKRMAKVIGIG